MGVGEAGQVREKANIPSSWENVNIPSSCVSYFFSDIYLIPRHSSSSINHKFWGVAKRKIIFALLLTCFVYALKAFLSMCN